MAGFFIDLEGLLHQFFSLVQLVEADQHIGAVAVQLQRGGGIGTQLFSQSNRFFVILIGGLPVFLFRQDASQIAVGGTHAALVTGLLLDFQNFFQGVARIVEPAPQKKQVTQVR